MLRHCSRALAKNGIEGAMATIGSLVQPTTFKPYNELNAGRFRARKLFFNIATPIDLAEQSAKRVQSRRAKCTEQQGVRV